VFPTTPRAAWWAVIAATRCTARPQCRRHQRQRHDAGSSGDNKKGNENSKNIGKQVGIAVDQRQSEWTRE
jgi:hypothetical protein